MTVAILALGWLAGMILFSRFRTCPVPSTQSRLSVSIIIPARDEAQNLTRLLPSLHSQLRAGDEIIVVDDGSVDATAEIARDLGAKVVTPGAVPSGWFGKPWACWQGSRHTAAPLLLFVDADAWFAPDGLNRLICSLGSRAACSVQPSHETRRTYEGLSLFFNFLVVAGVCGLGARGAGLFSVCLLFRRDSYEAVGGHQVVRQTILEGPAFAQSLSAMGLPHASYSGLGTVSFQMYPRGVRELWEGWGKGFSGGASGTPITALLISILWLSGAMTAFRLVGTPWGAGAYVLYAFQFAWLSRQIGRFPVWAVAFYPIPLVFFFILFAHSIFLKKVRGQVHWKGRALAVS